PCAARPGRRPRFARRARDRAFRPRLCEPLSVPGRRLSEGGARGGRGGDDRHRRPGNAACSGEELRARGSCVPAGAVPRDFGGAPRPRRAVAGHAEAAGGVELPACVIVKHANPCGVAVSGSIEQAYDRALAADPVSAYGGVVVLNRPVSEALGERLAEQFVEVLFAPGYDDAALARLREKPSVRILEERERRLSN